MRIGERGRGEDRGKVSRLSNRSGNRYKLGLDWRLTDCLRFKNLAEHFPQITHLLSVMHNVALSQTKLVLL